MSDLLTERELELIERWVVESEGLTRSELEELESSDAARARMAEFVDSGRTLDRLGEQAILAEVAESAAVTVHAPGFEAKVTELTLVKDRPRPWHLLLLALAALVPLCIWLVWPGENNLDPKDRNRQMLSEGADLDLAWDGNTLTWKKQQRARRIKISVLDAQTGVARFDPVRFKRPTSAWHPSAQQLEQMTPPICIEVEVRMSGNLPTQQATLTHEH